MQQQREDIAPARQRRDWMSCAPTKGWSLGHRTRVLPPPRYGLQKACPSFSAAPSTILPRPCEHRRPSLLYCCTRGTQASGQFISEASLLARGFLGCQLLAPLGLYVNSGELLSSALSSPGIVDSTRYYNMSRRAVTMLNCHGLQHPLRSRLRQQPLTRSAVVGHVELGVDLEYHMRIVRCVSGQFTYPDFLEPYPPQVGLV
jgi:hypothetical protein